MEPLKTRHLTVLLTDKSARRSRAEILAMLEKHKELVLPVLACRGRHDLMAGAQVVDAESCPASARPV
ncbi:MAG TPA: hypothetical protein VNK24_08810 [Elusimicrobiota bacterium]|nr:hypothetical protein [Elusimicrobiota bacterium]